MNKNKISWVVLGSAIALAATAILPLSASASYENGAFYVRALGFENIEAVAGLDGTFEGGGESELPGSSGSIKLTFDTNDDLCTTGQASLALFSHGGTNLDAQIEVGGDTLTAVEGENILPSTGTFQVTITGVVPAFGDTEISKMPLLERVPALNSCLVSVDEWSGDTQTTSLAGAFWLTPITHIAALPDNVTDFSGAFGGASKFNEPLNVDTSQATKMRFMFFGAQTFNQPLGDKFDTSNVTDMSSMFSGAQTFNQPLGDKFDTSNVTDMSSMFSSALSFNQSLGDKFDTSNVTNMSSMFAGAQAFNQPLGDKFDTSNVTDMMGMFAQASSFNQPLGDKFDTSKVTNMNGMFQESAFNRSLGDKFDTSNVTNMPMMFYRTPFNQPLGDKFDTSNVTNMGWMFREASNFNQDLSGWNVSKVPSSGRNSFSTGSALTTENLPVWS